MNALPTLSHRDEFPALFNDLGLIGHGVEVGVSYGGFASHLRGVWKGAMLYLVDRWIHVPEWQDSANVSPKQQEEFYYGVCRAFHWRRDVQVWRMDSLEAAARLSDESLDWVYIDADHSYEAVRADIAAWYPKIRQGGIIAGHDYMNGMVRGCLFEVRRAVDEWVEAANVSLCCTREEIAPSWYCLKP